MAVRLKSLYYSDANVPYGLEVHDLELESDLDIDFDMPISGAPVISYENDEIDIFSPVVASSCKFTMWIDTLQHRAFFRDLALSTEGRFFIRVFYVTETGLEITIHIGNVVHDLVSIDESIHPTFTISSTDPIMELDAIDFVMTDDMGGITDTVFHSYKSILIEYILKKIKCLNYFYPSDNDVILEILNEYYSEYDSDPNDMISRTFIRNYFFENSNGKLVRRSCMYVLAEVLKSIGARIYFDSSRYIIEQIGAKINESTISTLYLRNLSFLGTTTGNSTDIEFTLDKATEVIPRTTLLPPARYVRLEQFGTYRENLLYNYELRREALEDDPVTVGYVADVDSSLKAYCRIKLREWWEIYNSTGGLRDYDDSYSRYRYRRLSLLIQIGDKYLSGDDVLTYNHANRILTVEGTTWSNDPNSRVTVMYPVLNVYADLNQNAESEIVYIDIISPPIESSGDLKFSSKKISYDTVLYSDYNKPNPPSPVINFFYGKSNTLSILKDVADEEEETGSITITLENNENNTVPVETRYDMGSYPDTNSKRRVMVLDGNGDLVDSEFWRHPDHDDMAYQYLALYDILSVYRHPLRRFEVTMHVPNFPLRMMNRLVYDGKVYIPFHISNNTGTDYNQGVWIEIDKDVANMPPPIEDLPVDSPSNFLNDPITNNLQSQEERYYRLFPSVEGGVVVLDDYDEFPDINQYTERSVQGSWSVYLGSAKQRFRNLPKNQLSTGEYRINSVDRELEWSRDITGRVVEVYVVPSYANKGVTS